MGGDVVGGCGLHIVSVLEAEHLLLRLDLSAQLILGGEVELVQDV